MEKKRKEIKTLFLNVLNNCEWLTPSVAKFSKQKSILRVRLISNNSGSKLLPQIVFSLLSEI